MVIPSSACYCTFRLTGDWEILSVWTRLHKNYISDLQKFDISIMAVNINKVQTNDVIASESSDDDFQTPSTSRSAKLKSGIIQSIDEKLETMKCPQCQYHTNDKSNLNRHLNRHNKPTNCEKLKVSFKCAECKYETVKSSNWKKHLESAKHKTLCDSEDLRIDLLQCPEPQCTFTASRLNVVHTHLELSHSRILEKEMLKFRSWEEFKIWKNNLQATESV
ncbi:unnamed protein product, partial [Allacma fusca]